MAVALKVCPLPESDSLSPAGLGLGSRSHFLLLVLWSRTDGKSPETEFDKHSLSDINVHVANRISVCHRIIIF